jgi:transposase
MNSEKYIGLDVHQATISVAVLDSTGKLVMESILETKAAIILEFFAGLRGTLSATFEEGTWAAWLYDLLKPHVVKLVVCNPRKNALLKDGNKSDRIDAHKLAELLYLNKLCSVYHGETSSAMAEQPSRASLSRIHRTVDAVTWLGPIHLACRDLRQLLWHRHRMVQARTRLMNQLQAVALNEGLRCKKRLWREQGREQLESFRLAPWASRRRHDLLELLDRLNPTITELSQAVEQEAEKCPEAQRLMTHPGVGPLTALAFVLIIGQPERFQCGKQIASYLGLVPLEDSSGNRRRLGHITKQGNSLLRFLLVEAAQVAVRSLPEWRSKYVHLTMRRGRKIAKVAIGAKTGGSPLLDDAQGMGGDSRPLIDVHHRPESRR